MKSLQALVLLLLSSAIFFVEAQEDSCNTLSVGETVAVDPSGSIHLVGRSLLDQDDPNSVSVFHAQYNRSGVRTAFSYLPLDEDIKVKDVEVTPAGSVYLVGHTNASLAANSAGNQDVVLAQYRDGEPVWLDQFGTSGEDVVWALDIAEDGKIYIAGTTEGSLTQPVSGDNDQFVVAYSESGERLWVSQLSFSVEGSDFPTAVTADSDGNVYLTGNFSEKPIEENVPVGINIFTARLDETASELWRRELAGAMFDLSRAIYADDEFVLIAGNTSNRLDEDVYNNEQDEPGQSIDGLMAAYNPSGDLVWLKQFGYFHSYSGEIVTRLSTGEVILISKGNDDIGGPEIGASDITLQLYSSGGDELWAAKLGTASFDEPRAVTVDESDAVYLTGFIKQEWNTSYERELRQFGCETFLAKYDSTGQLQWFDSFDAAP